LRSIHQPRREVENEGVPVIRLFFASGDDRKLLPKLVVVASARDVPVLCNSRSHLPAEDGGVGVGRQREGATGDEELSVVGTPRTARPQLIARMRDTIKGDVSQFVERNVTAPSGQPFARLAVVRTTVNTTWDGWQIGERLRTSADAVHSHGKCGGLL
jgi:hypothetical protein